MMRECRYYQKMDDGRVTPVQTLKAAKQIAIEEGIKHVYLGLGGCPSFTY